VLAVLEVTKTATTKRPKDRIIIFDRMLFYELYQFVYSINDK